MKEVTERREVLGIVHESSLIQVSVRIWEPSDSDKSIICVHGFAGTGWDFSIPARTLTKSGYTLIAPDIIGRGESSFLGDEGLYNLRNYVACIDATSKFEKANKFHLGTSWGGVILLIYLATRKIKSKGLILNDIPIDSDENLKRFRALLADEAKKFFTSREEAEEYLISSRSMGFLNGADRDAFLQSRLMKVGDTWRMKYDPAIVGNFGNRGEFSLYNILAELTVPTLMTFGEESPYAGSPRLSELQAANSNITIVKNMDDPHPPSLMKLNQILQVAGFLAQCG